MLEYIKGIVTMILPSYIVVENNGIGYRIYTPNPYSYKEGSEYTIYIYEQIREDEHSLYGFNDISEKDMFLKLIDVKGLGPKMALPMLATGSINGICDAINRENVLYLTKFPKIGEKLARQIILDLKGKLDDYVGEDIGPDETEDLMETLTALGYKPTEIKKVIGQIDKSLSLEEQVKEALRLLLK